MSVATHRSGPPHVFLGSYNTTGDTHSIRGVSHWIRIRVSTNPCKVYFSETAFNNDIDYITIPVAAAATPYGEWSGPIEISNIWFKATTGTTNVELVAAYRIA